MNPIEQYITCIPDFPEPGVLFRDITTVLCSAEGFRLAIDQMIELLDGIEFDAIAGLESRGFIFGSAIAYRMNKAFFPVRKKGKLPRETIEETYNLEYGTATLEMHKDDMKPGTRVVLVDDLMATGGTLRAAAALVERLGGSVSAAVCLLELKGLNGRANLPGYNVLTVLSYDGK